MAKVLCETISSRRSLLALGWSITSILAFGAFLTAAITTARINSHYNDLIKSYGGAGGGGGYYHGRRVQEEDQNGESGDQNGESGDQNGSGDQNRDNNEWNAYQSLASLKSRSIAFTGLYTAGGSLAMSIFGGAGVVGFVSPRGTFVEPVWTRSVSGNRVGEKELGMFLGALVLFSNVCLVCAVILGEFQVVVVGYGEEEGGGMDQQPEEEQRVSFGSYRIETIATVLAMMCGFLALIYFLYAILLFALKDVVITYTSIDYGVGVNYSKSEDSYKTPILL